MDLRGGEQPGGSYWRGGGSCRRQLSTAPATRAATSEAFSTVAASVRGGDAGAVDGRAHARRVYATGVSVGPACGWDRRYEGRGRRGHGHGGGGGLTASDANSARQMSRERASDETRVGWAVGTECRARSESVSIRSYVYGPYYQSF